MRSTHHHDDIPALVRIVNANYNYEMRLDLRASTSVFTADASFTVTTPLA
jgi:hypothetical protein